MCVMCVREQTAGPSVEVNAALERDTYMTAAEATKFGLVDKEITGINEMGLAPPKATTPSGNGK